MTDTNKIGDAALARKVTAAYAEGLDALNADECKGLGIDDARCRALGLVLNSRRSRSKGEVTQDERNALADEGFTREFVDGIAGVDGKKALRQRVKWLADHMVERWWRKDYRAEDRIAMPCEIETIGADDVAIIPRLAEILGGVYEGGSHWESSCTAHVLAGFGASAVPALKAALKNKDPKVRFAAADTLSSIGPAAKDAAPALIEALKDDDRPVRKYAALALGNIGPAAREAMPALVEMLRDTDKDVRWCTMVSLGQIDPSAVPVFVEALGDEETNIRALAASSLGRIGKAAHLALPFLEDMRDNPKEDTNCRKAAGEAVEKILKEVR